MALVFYAWHLLVLIILVFANTNEIHNGPTQARQSTSDSNACRLIDCVVATENVLLYTSNGIAAAGLEAQKTRNNCSWH